jgi:hypothetical protein
MRLDEAGDDAQISLHCVPMDERGGAVVGGAQLNMGIAVVRLGMMRSLGVARVRSVKRMQIFVSALINCLSGFSLIGFSNAANNEARSSGNPSRGVGVMTVVRSSGHSMGNCPLPYAN